MRRVPLINNEFYHIYNRGVDKRNIFTSHENVARFFQCMKEFNTIKPIGSLYLLSRKPPLSGPTAKKSKNNPIVEFVAFCLNPNHYHFILKQISNNGISEFMKRLNGGYTWHFNNKHDRNGALFQGKFKSAHISSDDQFLRLSAYVNLNDRVHRLSKNKHPIIKSSWEEYVGKDRAKFCNTNEVLKHFKNKREYKHFALETIQEIIQERSEIKGEENIEEFKKTLLE